MVTLDVVFRENVTENFSRPRRVSPFALFRLRPTLLFFIRFIQLFFHRFVDSYSVRVRQKTFH